MRAEQNHTRSRWKLTGVIVGLAFVTWMLTLVAKKNPEKVEGLYASKIYPIIANIIGTIVGKIPFSIAEVVVFGALIGIVAGTITLVLKPSCFEVVFHGLIRTLGVGYMLFYFAWGFNYYRQDYIDLAGMNRESGTPQELKKLADEIIDKMNDLRKGLKEDENGVFIMEEDFSQLAKIAKAGFVNYTVGDVNLPAVFGTAKPLLISKKMSYTGITGIYFPYTGEPNVNISIPHTNIPATICHEMGHQMGFAKEEEANFIAYKASVNNPNPAFQYSGYYLALQHLLGDLHKMDIDLYDDTISKMSEGIKRDMDQEYDYWKVREGKAEKVATTLNDNYLKANNQVAGVKSYNGVVKLLLAEYKSR